MFDHVEPNFPFISEYVENNEISVNATFVHTLLKNAVGYIGHEVVHFTFSIEQGHIILQWK